MQHAPTIVSPATDRPASRRRRGFLALLLALTTVSLGAGLFSLAIFTDTASTSGTFSSGTVDITSSPSVLVTVNNMVPGDTNTQALTIANAGTASLRYALSTTATTLLGDTLTLEIRTVGTGCTAFDGTSVLAATILDGAALGSPTQGVQGAERTLAAASSEVLCFRIALPLVTGNTLQGLSSAVVFTFDAEQTANNP